MNIILQFIMVHMIISAFNWIMFHCISDTEWFRLEYGSLPGELWLFSMIPFVNLLIISAILFLLYEMLRDYLIKWWKYDSVAEYFKNLGKKDEFLS